MSDLRVVARYSFPYEAQLARSKLEAAGLLAFVLDEHTINMQWLYSDALGGVKLAVPASEVERALALLNEDCSQDLDEEMPVDELKKLTCMHCGSDQLEAYIQGKKPAFLVFLLIGFPLFFYRRGFKCVRCSGFTPAKLPLKN